MSLAYRLAARALSPVGLLLLTALLLAWATSPLWAADGTTVAIPVGDLTTTILDAAGPVLVAAVLWLLRQLPAEIVAALRMVRFEQLVARAIDSAIAATEGAAKGKTLAVPVANQVVAAAAEIAIARAPALIAWACGEGGLREALLARLDVEPAATEAGGELVKAGG